MEDDRDALAEVRALRAEVARLRRDLMNATMGVTCLIGMSSGACDAHGECRDEYLRAFAALAESWSDLSDGD